MDTPINEVFSMAEKLTFIGFLIGALFIVYRDKQAEAKARSDQTATALERFAAALEELSKAIVAMNTKINQPTLATSFSQPDSTESRRAAVFKNLQPREPLMPDEPP